ncbi:MAG: aldehyde dehydrogenase family protein [Calditrichaeota bacterium]|nr:aldehyde dehydrogenase family protein [Calditrichota bacterium]
MAKRYRMLIDGEWREGKDTFAVTNPFSGQRIAAVARGSPADLSAAIAAARRAFDTTRRMPPYERVALLQGIVAGMRKRAKELAETIVAEAGKPIRFAQGEVDRAIYTFTVAAEEAKRIAGEVIPLDLLPTAKGHFGYTRRYPIGVIGAISPFNFPLNLVCHKLAPCLASGNTMVLKPSSFTPVTAIKLGEIVTAAGAPPGAFNVVPCPAQVGEILATEPGVAMLTFTGSAEVGWRLKSLAGKKKVTLELGGNAAAIVHEDADLDFAASRLALGGFAYAGQVCIAVQRIFVHRRVFDGFTERLLEATRKTMVGDPADPDTVCGPMITEQAAITAQQWIQEALAAGAQLLTGGERDGAMLEPTVLTKTTPDMKVRSEEVFAPIVTVDPYETFDEAVAAVNESRFGLQAAVFTNDIRLIMQAHDEIVVGGLVVNDYPTFRIDHMPYGGVKDSGFGREGLKYAIEEMTEPRLLVLNLPQKSG